MVAVIISTIVFCLSSAWWNLTLWFGFSNKTERHTGLEAFASLFDIGLDRPCLQSAAIGYEKILPSSGDFFIGYTHESNPVIVTKGLCITL